MVFRRPTTTKYNADGWHRLSYLAALVHPEYNRQITLYLRYMTLNHARSAAALFHQEQSHPKMITWSMTGYELVKDKFVPCGDHAGKWETSLLMHLDPGMQDISILNNSSNDKPIGASDNGIEDSTPEFGKKAVEAIIEAVSLKVTYFLENPNEFQGHGSPM